MSQVGVGAGTVAGGGKQQPTEEEKKQEQKHKSKHRRANTTKIRVKLPSIDSYQREVIFRYGI